MYIIQTNDVTWVAVFSPEACEICKIFMEILTKTGLFSFQRIIQNILWKIEYFCFKRKNNTLVENWTTQFISSSNYVDKNKCSKCYLMQAANT